MTQQSKIRVVSATEAKNRFGDILKGTYQRDEHFVVERAGIPVAVIIPIQDYNAFTPANEEQVERAVITEREQVRARAAADMRTFLDEIQSTIPIYPEEVIQKDIEDAIRAVRGQ